MDGLETVSKTTTAPARPSDFEVWWHAARPHTLTIAVVPVVLGTALAAASGHRIDLLVCAVTLLAATLIQIGTNLHNDVGDFHRGADAVGRLGPPRPTSLGWLTPGQVRTAVSAVFGLAFALGAYLAWYGGWPILAIGVFSVVAGLAYTSGPRPIAYTGLGEVFVWLFFGLIAVCGTYYLQAFGLSAAAVTAGTLVGLHAAAVLVVNPFALLPLLYAQTGNGLALLLPLASAPAAAALVRRFWRESPGPAFNRILGQTAVLQVAFGMLVAAAFALGG